MENPADDIASVITSLCQGNPDEQRNAVERYFTPTASFVHPFCWVPSFAPRLIPFVGPIDSRWVILAIYRWYRFLSPKIQLKIDSTAFDDTNNILFVSLRQTFAVWFVPFYAAHVRLVTVLTLVRRANVKEGDDQELADYVAHAEPALHDGVMRYYIEKQEDQYQVNEFLKFLMLDLGAILWKFWQLGSTILCVGGVLGVFCLQALSARSGLGHGQKRAA